ncbi:Hypothetical predicted protein [Olea europaea subsp. europaea]|uniref:Uncharacterized protein n=1 Tax=Olea europaea subsp. europaea TaxID=158383 RepID=A0A8S0UIP9_OLEEU|nr:Hypothetical predicted protein [Olea europaea subsp. europaea]
MPNLISKSQDSGQKSFEIKNDNKFFSRLLAKESTKTNPSFRVYYGDVSVAVPFMWETRPGTPKHHTIFYDDATSVIPPLSPPPSYYSTNRNKPLKTSSRSRILHTLLRRIDLKKINQFKMSSSSSSSSSSSVLPLLSWSTSLPPSRFHGEGRRFSRRGTSLFDDNYKDVCLIMKKAWLSIFRRGSG